jgi:hypothetical protein
VLDAALQAAQSIDDEEDRVGALAALVPYLPEAQQAGVLDAALQAAQSIDDEEDRVGAR